jgi:hypothetical protein
LSGVRSDALEQRSSQSLALALVEGLVDFGWPEVTSKKICDSAGLNPIFKMKNLIADDTCLTRAAGRNDSKI